MSESREDRIATALKAIDDNGWGYVIHVPTKDLQDLAAHVVDALFPPPPEERPKAFPFDRSHGSLYDRGSADSYYRRPRDPHYGGVGGDSGSRVDVTGSDHWVAEYNEGYDDNEREGNHND